MWVYRVEKTAPHSDPAKAPPPRHVELHFSEDYKLYHTHKQRIATELRVPMFAGFTVPPSTRDSETAALYKQMLTRPLAITPASVSKDPEDVRLVKAFLALCVTDGSDVEDRNVVATKAFATAWVGFRRDRFSWTDSA